MSQISGNTGNSNAYYLCVDETNIPACLLNQLQSNTCNESNNQTNNHDDSLEPL